MKPKLKDTPKAMDHEETPEVTDHRMQSLGEKILTYVPDEFMSATTAMWNMSRSMFSDFDYSTPAPKQVIIEKAQNILASSVMGPGSNLEEVHPGANDLFRRHLRRAIDIVISRGDSVSVIQLVAIYVIAVDNVKQEGLNQFPYLMFSPIAMGRFFDYFSVPVNPDIIADLETKNPELAARHKSDAKRWMQPSGR